RDGGTGSSGQGPRASRAADRHRGGRGRTAGAEGAGGRGRVLSDPGPGRRRAEWPDLFAKAGFWSIAPTVLQGQILPTLGGAPIAKGGRLIGAIGCGGGPGGEGPGGAGAGGG